MDRKRKSTNNCSIVRTTSDPLLKRSPSLVMVSSAKSDLYLRDPKVCDIAEEHHTDTISDSDATETDHHEDRDRLFGQISIEGVEVKTRDVFTNEILSVKEDMLLHKGRKHSFEEIASKWKKDCRTWLWKNKTYDTSTMRELQRDFEKLGK